MPGSGRTDAQQAALATAFAALIASLVISGCSSSAKAPAASTSSATTAPASPSPSTSTSASPSAAAPTPADAATTAAVSKAYTTLFNTTAGVSTTAKTAVLQDGPAFAADIDALSKSPLTKGLSVSVTGVSLLSATEAKVTFSLLMAGKVLLSGQSGYALLQGGTWKVAADTLCGLLALQGKGVPPACTSPAAALP